MNATFGPAVASVEAEAVDRVLTSAVSPGSTLSGGERRHVALRSRRAMEEASRGEPSTAAAQDQVTGDARTWLVDRITAAPHTLRNHHVDQLAAEGLGASTYVEILGLVARLQAVDTFCFGIGAELPELAEAADGEPSGSEAQDARVQGGWVPTVGPASPPNALTLIPSEHEAMHDLHGALYLAVEDMGDLNADRGLHRTQMEFVAARTSLLNECYF